MVVEKERGLSMTGFLFTTVVIIVVALVAFRVVPSYIEFFTVQKALDQTMQEVSTPTVSEIRRSMDRRLSADYVDSVRSSDVLIGREGNLIVATLSWQKVLHMIGNASILLEFEARSTRG
jgi:tetrahydromethanopterin S-methyltransferase subunit F